MAGINPNILLQLGQGVTQPVSPLQTMQNALQLGVQQNALQTGRINNQRAQAQYDADLALGRDYQKSVDPNTGRFDTAAFQKRVAADPDAAIYAGRDIAHSQQMQGTQTANDDTALQLKQHRAAAYSSLIGSLAAHGGNATADQVRAVGNVARKLYGEPDSEIYPLQNFVINHPQGIAAGVKALQASMLSPEAQVGANYGTAADVNTGGQEVIGTRDSAMNGGALHPSTIINRSPSPDTLSQPVQYTDTAGNPRMGTVGSVDHSVATGTGPASIANGPNTFGKDSINAAMQRYQQGQGAISGLQNSAQGLTRAYDLASSQVVPTGRGGSELANAKGFVNTVMETFGMQPGESSAENYQTLHKYLANAASNAAAQAGYSGSDARMSAFMSGQANPDTMNTGALRNAILYTRAQQMGALEKARAMARYINSTGDYAGYPQYEAKWNAAYSPEAMYYHTLPGAEKKAYLSHLSKSDAKALATHLSEMKQVGAWNGQ